MKFVKFKLHITGIFSGLVLLSAGCSDFLDTTPTDRISDKVVWNDKSTVTLYVNTFYAYIDRYGIFASPSQFSGNLTEGLTETLKYGSYVPGSKAGDSNNYLFAPEMMQSSGNLLDVWGVTYERIRRINEFLVGLKMYSKLSVADNDLFEAQARFFRAYLYFQLAKRHGGVILYRDMNIQKDINRSSEEATWDFIEEDLNYAATYLPKRWTGDNAQRISKGVAFAFKSRAMLYAQRYEQAKIAADSVFTLNMYALAGSYADAYRGGNSESILEYRYLTTGPNHSFDKDYATYGEINNQGGSGVPTQEMVESYEKTDGTAIDWTPWHSTAGTNTPPPYSSLEPRFHATVIYPGSTWQGKVMENCVGGNNGRYLGYRDDMYTQGRTVTGYYLKKFRDETNTDLTTYLSKTTWVEIRLAEVYLNRAEANYRLGNATGALADLNVVRQRQGVNLPPRTGLTGAALFAAIRRERKIELAYEGHLYWDMRRWKLAHVEYSNYRVHGLKLSRDAAPSGFLYQYADCDLQDRKFLIKMYVFPVPYDEMSNNMLIEQYDEWK